MSDSLTFFFSQQVILMHQQGRPRKLVVHPGFLDKAPPLNQLHHFHPRPLIPAPSLLFTPGFLSATHAQSSPEHDPGYS